MIKKEVIACLLKLSGVLIKTSPLRKEQAWVEASVY